jgi:hypothetical protein
MGTRYFADHSPNCIKMLGVYFDPRAAGKLDHDPG